MASAPAPSRTRPPIVVNQTPDRAGQDDREADRDLELALGHQPGGRDPDGSLAIRRVGTAPKIRQIVGQVGRDLQQQRNRQAAVATSSRNGRPHGQRRTEPDDHAAERCRQGRRPDGEQPDSQRRRSVGAPGSAATVGSATPGRFTGDAGTSRSLASLLQERA